MSLKIKYIATGGLILYLASMVLMLTMRTESLPQIQSLWLGIPADKIVHGLIFLPYPTLAWLATYDKHRSRKWQIIVPILILSSGVAMAGCTEVIQNFIEYRQGDIKDFAADCIGLAIGMIIIMTIASLVQRRRR